VRLDVSGVDHLGVAGSPPRRQFTEQSLPNAALRPAHEAIVDRCWRAVFWRAIAPTAAAFEHVQDAADHTPVVHTLLAAHVGRQIRFYPRPLIVVKPKQVASHPICLRITEKWNQQLIQPARLLLGVRPNLGNSRGVLSPNSEGIFRTDTIPTALDIPHSPEQFTVELVYIYGEPGNLTRQATWKLLLSIFHLTQKTDYGIIASSETDIDR